MKDEARTWKAHEYDEARLFLEHLCPENLTLGGTLKEMIERAMQQPPPSTKVVTVVTRRPDAHLGAVEP